MQGFRRLVVTEEAAVKGEALRQQLAGAGVELFAVERQGKQAGREAEGQRYSSLVAMLPHLMSLIQLAS